MLLFLKAAQAEDYGCAAAKKKQSAIRNQATEEPATRTTLQGNAAPEYLRPGHELGLNCESESFPAFTLDVVRGSIARNDMLEVS